MRLSIKTEYALAALLDMAYYTLQNKPITTKEIAQRTNIPKVYLEQIMSKLRRDGVIESFRGTKGGYKLLKPMKDIRIGDVVSCVEGDIRLASCDDTREENCNHSSGCVTRNMWEKVSRRMIDTLNELTLAELYDDFTKHTEFNMTTVFYSIDKIAVEN